MAQSVPAYGNPRQEQQINPNSAIRYATDEFFAACVVRPQRLIEHPHIGTLPIGRFLPDPLSLRRLEEMDVEELAVFCGPVITDNPDDQRADDLQWAAVARSSRPIQLEAAMKQWRHSLVTQDKELDAKPVAVKIEHGNCFRVAAGTFFPAQRAYGELHFTDRHGQLAKRGVNVGRIYESRSYVEGATNASAIFTLDNLDEADLDEDHLPLELRLDVFLTYFPDREYTIGQIEVRNPDSGLRSEPIKFEAKSYVNRCLKVPRKVIAVDADGSRQVDLIKDLASNGRLEVVLKATEPRIYLGVGRQDLNVRPKAFEYVFVSDREIVVAQSRQTLKKMLSAAATPASLANRLSKQTGDMVVIASVRGESQRVAFRRLIRKISDHSCADLLGNAAHDLTVAVVVNGPANVQVTAQFKNDRSASTAANELNQLIRRAKAYAHTTIGDSLRTLATSNSLASIALDGVPMSFPARNSPTIEARESQMLSIIDDLLDNVRVKSAGNTLSVRITQPASLSRLPEVAKVGLANMEEVLARDLFARERFDLGDEMYGRVTDRFPHVPQAWFRRAHQLTYNMSVEFDGYANRYVWIRRGVEVLLDGAEQNPDTTDLTWMAAKFIGWKIGTADERTAYRQLFSQDERLHKRLAKMIDLEKTQSPDKKVDNWLVAKLLFEYCVDRRKKSQASSTIPPLLFFSRPAAVHARYAQALSESGHWDLALRAWKHAEQLHNQLGDSTIPLGEEGLRLNDLDSRLAEFGSSDASVKRLQVARRLIQFDYWLTRCQLEQTAELQRARKLRQEAAKAMRRPEPKAAYDLYRQTLRALAELSNQRPQQMSLLAGEFKHVAGAYKRSARSLGEPDDESLAPIITLIETSQPVSASPYFDVRQADEGAGPLLHLLESDR